jgi:Kef-type K+ transport system membrane component KefB
MTVQQQTGTNELFLVAMLIVFAGPFLIWKYLKADQFAPVLIGQMLIGIVLGPGVFGAHFPYSFHFIFNSAVLQSLDGISNWGVMLFVFIAGLELELSEAWQLRRETGVVASLALGIPLVLGCLAAWVLLRYADWMPPGARPWQFLLGIGMACATTALPLLVLLLGQLDLLDKSIGKRSMRYASLDDLLIWTVLAVVLMNWHRVGGETLFLLGFAAAAVGFRRLMARLAEPDRWYFALVWLVAVSLAAEWLGLHFVEGAFLAGASLDAALFDRRKLDSLRHNVLMIMMPVFFLSSGLKADFSASSVTLLAAAGLLLLVSVGGKVLGLRIAGRLCRWPESESSIIGWLLQTKGLTMMVFARMLLDGNVISGEVFTALLIVAIASTLLTVPMVSALLARDRELFVRTN